jgi:Domain of unknown function (DUF4112)
VSPPLKPSPSQDPKSLTLRRLRRLSYLLDNSIPIPGIGRVGLDPLLGFLPVAGDTVSGVLSAYIVWEAARLGLPRDTLIKMVGNIVLETILGSVPVLGDLFDATWKSNAKNMVLLEDHLQAPQQRHPTDWQFVALLLGVVLIVAIAFAALSVLLFQFLLGIISH